jgi:hypothetical protein
MSGNDTEIISTMLLYYIVVDFKRAPHSHRRCVSHGLPISRAKIGHAFRDAARKRANRCDLM